MFKRKALSFAVLPVVIALTAVRALAADVAALDDELRKADCGDSEQQNMPYQFDYRSRGSTAASPIGTSAQWNYQDNWTNHTGPATTRLQAGEHSRQVIADLNFTFSRWPNHLHALQALIKYYSSGGQQYEFLPAECYFRRAIKFAPDDADLMVVTGIHFFKQNKMSLAREAFQGALAINPQSLEAHYNLGLVYVQLKDLPKAKEHAKEAYSGGYPLPGLKKKLEQAGAW